MSLTISDICNDLKTFLESICRTCSRIDSGDGDLQFKRIFASAVEQQLGFEEEPPNNYHTSEELKGVFDEILLWKLNIEPDDGLPQQICHECFERFNGVKHFRNLCIDTQTLLKSYINHVDTLLESGSLGRLSPRGSESIKDEACTSPSAIFDVNNLVEESPETPERKVVSHNNSPQLSPKYEQQQLSPRQNMEAVYADSSMGTPPPLFDEINTEPIDMETMEYLKAESELDVHKASTGITADQTSDILNPLNFDSSSSEDEDDNDVDNEIEEFDHRRLPMQCKVCFATFQKRKLLKEHCLRVHPQVAPYICSICSKTFKSKFLLSQHKYKHSRLDSLKCEKCGKHFRSQLHLQRHHKNFHLTSTYACHICNEKFENYTQMRFQYHVRQHGEKRFECRYCEKSFHQKVHQINHERTHTGEQPFRCDICGKCYRQQTACREHMLKHEDPTPFKCSICLKGFTQRSSLRTHLRSHSNNDHNNSDNIQESNFGCLQLNHKSNHNFGLNMQLSNINSQGFAQKVLHCKFCDKSFQKQQLLLLHIQQSHGVNIESEDGLDSRFPFSLQMHGRSSPSHSVPANNNGDLLPLFDIVK